MLLTGGPLLDCEKMFFPIKQSSSCAGHAEGFFHKQFTTALERQGGSILLVLEGTTIAKTSVSSQ